MYKKLILILCASTFLVPTLSNSKTIPMTLSLGILSENKKYVYMHINEKDVSDEVNIRSEIDGVNFKLPRKFFSQEGLYLINERKFLWVIGDKINTNSVIIHPMNDGMHLMLEAGKPLMDIYEQVFSFYKNGKIVKKYAIADFCTDESMFLISSIGPNILWNFNEKIDSNNNIYSFTSCDKNFSIDMSSGKISVEDNFFIKIKNKILRWTGQNINKNVLY